MTVTCQIENCPFCAGEACHVCGTFPVGASVCAHDVIERHAAWPPIDIAVARTGTPTMEMAPLLSDEIELQVTQGDDSLANFFTTIGLILKTTGTLHIKVSSKKIS